jgi:hypothetical protein
MPCWRWPDHGQRIDLVLVETRLVELEGMSVLGDSPHLPVVEPTIVRCLDLDPNNEVDAMVA